MISTKSHFDFEAGVGRGRDEISKFESKREDQVVLLSLALVKTHIYLSKVYYRMKMGITS